MTPEKPGMYYVWELVSGKSFHAYWDGELWYIPENQQTLVDVIIDNWAEIE